MKSLYDFGISQDDPNVEAHAFDLENNKLLCIASGGEVPLSLLANYNTTIKALDFSINQIRLCKLKLMSVLKLEPEEASILIGFKKDLNKNWEKYFSKVISHLSVGDQAFWIRNKQNISRGPIRFSKFEQYISLFCKMALGILGAKKFRQLFEMDSIESQKDHFDKYLHKKIIYWIFQIAFSPLLYKNQGINKQGLIHQKGNELASIFYKRFRDFCTATPSRSNSFLQFYFLGEIIFQEAMPDYLKPYGATNICKREKNLVFETKSIQNEIIGSLDLNYTNYALSNISDWLSVIEMDEILNGISEKTSVNSNLLLRYIHKNPINEKMNNSALKNLPSFKKDMEDIDRFPFYSLIKLEKKSI